MLSTPHLLVGAAIGSTVGGVPAAFMFGVLSHLVLDVIPHADEDLLEIPGQGRIMPKDYWMVTLDIILGLAFVMYFATVESHIPENVLAGALGGIAPDIIGNVPFWSPIITKFPFIKQFHALHYFVGFKNNGTGRLFGVLTQFVAVILAVVVLMRQ